MAHPLGHCFIVRNVSEQHLHESGLDPAFTVCVMGTLHNALVCTSVLLPFYYIHAAPRAHENSGPVVHLKRVLLLGDSLDSA